MTPENFIGFFESELENYSTAVRQGDIDPAYGYIPTVATAIDSLRQAPNDIAYGWLGCEEDEHEQMVDVLIELADYAVNNAEKLLAEVVDNYYAEKRRHDLGIG